MDTCTCVHGNAGTDTDHVAIVLENAFKLASVRLFNTVGRGGGRNVYIQSRTRDRTGKPFLDSVGRPHALILECTNFTCACLCRFPCSTPPVHLCLRLSVPLIHCQRYHSSLGKVFDAPPSLSAYRLQARIYRFLARRLIEPRAGLPSGHSRRQFSLSPLARTDPWP